MAPAMDRLSIDVDPTENDPGRWGHSFANLAELFVPCMDAVGARLVVEVGAYAGDLTRLLLDWAGPGGARVVAIDPMPQPALVRLAEERPGLSLVRESSLEALEHIELPDVVIVDGDHNYHTVSEELRLIGERAPAAELPLLLFHDVGWPHGRRDAYYVPELIPESARRPLREGGGLFPGERGTIPGGLPYKWVAAEEGGARNGVLTAIEDFVSQRDGLRLVVVDAFFGFGAVWHTGAPWSDALAEILDPWDRNPLVARLEENRVFQLASGHVQMTQVLIARDRNARKDAVLRKLLDSGSFSLACRLSRLWRRGAPSFRGEELRVLLSD
jgi:Methyltransferase domain